MPSREPARVFPVVGHGRRAVPPTSSRVRDGLPLVSRAARLFCCRPAQRNTQEETMLQGRVLIADDDPLIRLDLRTMLESIGHEVVGEADNGENACYMARSLKPDLIILD